MSTHGVDTPILAACLCGDDPQLQLMRDLMNRGMGQLDASRIAFGNEPTATAGRDVWSTWVRVEARRIGNVARRQLGLPALPPDRGDEVMTEKPRPLSTRTTTCSRCRQPIVFARTLAAQTGTGGKSMPLDLYPNPEGNVAVRETGPGRLVCRVLAKDEDHDRQLEKRAMPHFATCGVEQGKQLADDVEAFLRNNAERSEP